jgi:signal transduction histidine kinase
MVLNASSYSLPLNSPDIFLNALEQVPEPIVLCQLDGLIIYANRSAQQGLKLMVGQSMVTLLRSQDWASVMGAIADEARSYETEVLFGFEGLRNVPLAIAVRQISEGLWLWRFQDLTRQRQREAEWVMENERLVRSSRHKSEFLSNMSHELRTPLTSILGFSSILKQKIFGDLNLKQETYIQQIYRSGQHLLALINDMLDLSKIEAGQMDLEKTQLQIKRVCQESIALIQDQAEAKKISINLSIDSSVSDVYADEVRVRQMMLNLLSNAIKFSHASGKIGVTVGRSVEMVTIAVQDEGEGIPLEKQGLIFQPFQQVDESIDRRRQGTGLGLVLTRNLAELHGGTVTFESVVGVGSSFVLRLPEGIEN